MDIFWNYTLLSFNKKNPYIAAFTEQASKKVTVLEVLEELQSFLEALAAILQLWSAKRIYDLVLFVPLGGIGL